MPKIRWPSRSPSVCRTLPGCRAVDQTPDEPLDQPVWRSAALSKTAPPSELAVLLIERGDEGCVEEIREAGQSVVSCRPLTQVRSVVAKGPISTAFVPHVRRLFFRSLQPAHELSRLDFFPVCLSHHLQPGTGRSSPRRRCLSGPGWPTPWRAADSPRGLVFSLSSAQRPYDERNTQRLRFLMISVRTWTRSPIASCPDTPPS